MERRENCDGSGPCQGDRGGKNDDQMRFRQNIMENLQKQTEILHQGLLTVWGEPRPGNVTDFRRLQPAVFSGTESALNAEQWLIDTTDLLKAARVQTRTKWK